MPITPIFPATRFRRGAESAHHLPIPRNPASHAAFPAFAVGIFSLQFFSFPVL
jgi:hypothetical protein